jgi:DNA-binding CsgD family transcriptional regulator
VIDPSVVARLVARKRVHDRLDDLSDRVRDVLAVMAEGRSDQAISERLYLSPKTVEAYVRDVFTRLGLHPGADDNRRVLAVLAFLGRSPLRGVLLTLERLSGTGRGAMRRGGAQGPEHRRPARQQQADSGDNPAA